ncbi:histidine acid [Fusarium beomiforme]|uniref:Histidine acid n=1 Tax=Fusarium beomiforme TaxID=44412 RepID=A0A9P5DVZ6_9HYPO|nr:histidine acid [Fusarium beomiforme]
MILFRLIAALSLAHGVIAQSTGGGEKVWAAVAFINHGERTPIAANLRTVLTPEGAQQMLRQGTAFRARYIPDGVNSSDYDNVQTAYLQNLKPDVIDNDDLDMISSADEWVSAGALAFMQGFYPPSSNAFDNSTGGEEIAVNLASSDNKTEYPLNGYQYPNIRTPSYYDPESTAVQGTARCSAWQTEITTNLTQEPGLDELYDSTLPFYQNLFSTAPLAGTIDIDYANLWSAYALWEFVDYQYRHNETVHGELKNANTTLSFLNTYAVTMERAQNSYQGDVDDNSELGMIYSVAGRTLAYKVAQQFKSNIRWGSSYNKLTFMFGSLDPIMSFISLSGLLTKDNMFQDPWASLPKPGAALVFELFGENPDSPDEQPSIDSLRVRMSYRASADADEPFQNQPLFKSGPSGIAYSNFISQMNILGTSPNQWCDVCGPTPAAWCIFTDSDGSNWGDDSSSMGPVIAGLIGAIIAIAVLAVLLTCMCVCGGLRFRRKGPEEPTHSAAAAGSTPGGFKGPEKKDGDADVVVTKQGIHHERVGSWELRSPNELPPQTSGIVTKDLGSPPRRRSLDDSDDDISVMGAAPVKARESV